MAGPLDGVRVLDLTRLLPGPYATLVLSDLGADVVKIEDPALGDYLRGISPGMFAALNRGKRSIALDLRSDAETFHKLCARADVLVESFRPGVLEKSLQVEPAQFPRLVVVRLSSFGQTGPLVPWAGHDVDCIALAGVLARGAPLPPVQIADFAGAFEVVTATLAALFERTRTGRGRVVDVSMTESAMQLALPALATQREPNVLAGTLPCYRVYRCSDGRRMALGALEPKFWGRFCAAVRKPEWEPRAFDPTLTPDADALFITKPREQWVALLQPADCCAAPVLELDELEAHPQHVARDQFVAPGLVRTQPAFVATGALPRRSAPALGQDTDAVLADWLRAAASP